MGLRWGLCAWFEYQTYSNLRAIPTAQRADHARQKLPPTTPWLWAWAPGGGPGLGTRREEVAAEGGDFPLAADVGKQASGA